MPTDPSATTHVWGPAALTSAKATALDWIKAHEIWLSERHTEVWDFMSRHGENTVPPPGM